MKTEHRKHLTCLLATLLLTACSKDEPAIQPAERAKALTFAPQVSDSAFTRVAHTRARLNEEYVSFRVWATKDMPDDYQPASQRTQQVINGYSTHYLTARPNAGGTTWGDELSSTNGASYWSYDHISGQEIKYWDTEAKSYFFSAIAPVTTFAEGDFSISPETHHITLNNLPGNISVKANNATDYVVALTQRGSDTGHPIGTATDIADYDCIEETPGQRQPGDTPVLPQPTAGTDDVPLNFHHIYSKVEFRIYAESPITLHDVTIALGDASDKMPTLGNYTTATHSWSGVTGTSKQIVSENYTDISGKQIPIKRENAVTLTANLEIPHEFLSGGRPISVTYTDNATGNSYTSTFVLTATNNGSNSWQQGKHYIYTLKITNGQTDSHEIILFAIDMNVWQWQEGSTVEDEQHDW